MEKNNYLISEMKIEDLENIKDILEVDFDEFWNYETLKEELESNFSKYFIAKQNDNIVGFAGLKIILDEADLMNIVTKKCCRHEGIASNRVLQARKNKMYKFRGKYSKFYCN